MAGLFKRKRCYLYPKAAPSAKQTVWEHFETLYEQNSGLLPKAVEYVTAGTTKSRRHHTDICGFLVIV